MEKTHNTPERDVSGSLISVIIPVYNVEKHLHECVDSVADQTYSNLEIILSDDGATDRSGAICDELAAVDSRIRVIHGKNRGPSEARNRGLDIALGEYVMFVDSDDMIHPSTIERLVKIASENGSPLVMTPEPMLSSTHKWCNEMPSDSTFTSNQETSVRQFLLRKIGRSTCCNLFHTSIFNNLRFSVGITSEDTLLMADVFSAVDKVCFTTNDYYFYRISHDGRSHSFNERKFDMITNAFAIDEKMARLPYDLTVERRYHIVTVCVDYCMQVIKHHVMHEYRKEYVEARSHLRKGFWRNLLCSRLSPRYMMKMILAVIR